MAEVGSAFVSLIPTLRGQSARIQSELDGAVGPAADKAGGKAGKRFGARMGSAMRSGVAAGVGAAGAAIAVKLLKESIGEAREAQKVGAVTNQIIKATGGVANISATAVGRLAESISLKTAVDDEAIQSGANLLLTFKNVRNEAGKGNKVFDRATKAAVDLAATGFGDINSASKQLGKALNDPVKGTTALSKAGVTFTQQQKDQIATLVQSGDVLSAQKIILAEVESQVGGVAAASSTSGEKLTNAFNQFKESIGTALLPVIDRLFVALTPLFTKLAANKPLLITLAVVVGGVLVGAFAALAVAVIAATWPFILIAVGIAALAALFVYAYSKSETFRKIVHTLGAVALSTGAAFLRLSAWVATAIASILGALGKIPSKKFQWARDGQAAVQGLADKLTAGAVKAEGLAGKLLRPTKDTKKFGDAVRTVPGSKSAKVTVSSLTKPIKDTSTLTQNIGKIPKSKPVKVTMNSLSTPIRQAEDLKSAIAGLKSKTITITTKYETSGTPPRKASGSIVSGAQRIIAGESGPEAIVPLDRPLNMVDPSVRWLSAYAQGKTELASMRPMSLDMPSSSSSDSSGPIPVVVTNANEVAAGTRRVAESVVSDEKAFAGTMGRMG